MKNLLDRKKRKVKVDEWEMYRCDRTIHRRNRRRERFAQK